MKAQELAVQPDVQVFLLDALHEPYTNYLWKATCNHMCRFVMLRQMLVGMARLGRGACCRLQVASILTGI